MIVLPKEHDMDTKGIIVEAMKQLLAEQRFDKITVQNIIDRAHCSRGTFYRHFKDKYDVMNYNYSSLLDRHVQDQIIHTMHDLFLMLLKEGQQYWKPLVPLFDTEGANSLYRFIRDYSFNAAKNIYECGNPHGGERVRTMTSKEILQLQIFAGGSADMYREWIRGNIPLTAEEAADAMTEILPLSLQKDLF